MSIHAARMSIQEARRVAYVEAITFPVRGTYGPFDTREVAGYHCRLVDKNVGLDLHTSSNTSDSAAMRALGLITGCWWQYAALS